MALAEMPSDAADEAVSGSAHRRSVTATVAVVAVFAVPLLLAALALHEPRWYPSADLAQTELRVRDVFSAHPPLIGLSGRFATFGSEQGSHLGPMIFYVLAPLHRLFGATSWALQVAAVSVQLTAVGATLWLARRRGGLGLVSGVAAVLAVLMHAYGAQLLSEAWIPYLPVLWWVVFLLSVWSVACGDVAMLPVAVGVGSLCVQTHVSYVGPVVVTGAVAVAVGLWPLRTRLRGRVGRWAAMALAVGIVAWLPPLLEQFTADGQGNLGKLLDYFRSPTEPALGIGEGARRLLILLDPWRLVANQLPSDGLPAAGSWVPGAILLVVWGGSVLLAWRLRHGELLRLHVVLGVAVAAAGASLSRLLGIPWNYLSLWVWGLSALLLLAVGWTAVTALAPRLTPLARPAAVVPGLVMATFLVLLAGDAASLSNDDERLSVVVGALVPSVSDRLSAGDVPGGGAAGRYRLTATDPVFRGFPVFGLVNELERDGFDVGMDGGNVVAVRPHRVIEPGEATAIVHLSSGSDVARWRAKPDVTEVARYDPRDGRQRRRAGELRADIVDRLEGAGLDDLVAIVDDIEVVAADPRIDEAVKRRVNELSKLGAPLSVFVGPPDAQA